MKRPLIVVATVICAALALAGCDDNKKTQQAADPSAAPAADAKPQQDSCVTVKDRTRTSSAQIVDSCTGETWFYNTTD